MITKGEGRGEDEALSRAIKLCQTHDTFNAALNMAKLYRNNAIGALDQVPDHPLKSQFLDIADYVINRSL